MATNRTPQDALDYARRFIGNMPFNDAAVQNRVLNDASDLFHLYAPWRWSIGVATPFALANGTDEYTVAGMSSFLHLLHGEVIDNAGRTESRLKPVAILPDAHRLVGVPRRVYATSATNVRLFPIPTGYTAGSEPDVFLYYKLTNTNVTDANRGTASTLLFPDEWFWVYQELVLGTAFEFAVDPRASAQRQQALQSLELAKQKELPYFSDLIGAEAA